MSYDLHCLNRWRYRELKALCRQYAALRRRGDWRAAVILDCAKRADLADWQAIIHNVGDGTSYERAASCQSMTQFYRSRAKFFTLLDEEMERRTRP